MDHTLLMIASSVIIMQLCVIGYLLNRMIVRIENKLFKQDDEMKEIRGTIEEHEIRISKLEE